MPGVPPDAIAQVKRGLKGLFFRKKKDSTQHTGEATGGGSNSTYSSTDGAVGTNNGTQYSTTNTGSSMPQISEPANVKASKNIELDPSAPSNNGTGLASSSLPESTPAKLESKAPMEGMSATSGPLSDDLSGVYGRGPGSPLEAKGQELLHPEATAPMEQTEQGATEVKAETNTQTADADTKGGTGADNASPTE